MRCMTFLALVCILVAGCATKTDPTGTPALPGEKAVPANHAAAARPNGSSSSATTQPTSPGASGSPTSAPGGPPSPSATPPPPPQPEITEFEGAWTGGVYVTGLPDAEVLGNVPLALDLDAAVTGVVAELVWTASTPLSSNMGITVFHAGATVAAAAGTSTVHLSFAKPGSGSFVFNARASGPAVDAGAFVSQSYRLFVAVFRDMPFDAGFHPAPS